MFIDEISQAPDWLIKQVVQCSSKPCNNMIPSSNLLSGSMFSSGRRNQDYTKVLGTLRRSNADSGLIERMINAINSELPEPLDDKEIGSVISSSARWEVSEIQAMTHISYADLLLNELEEKIKYVIGDGFWNYNGKYWENDHESLDILDEAVQLSDRILSELPKLQSQMHVEDFKSLKKSVYKTQAAGFLKSSIDIFKSKKLIRTKFEKFNNQKHLLNLDNGVYNLNNKSFINHNSQDLFTWSLNVDFDSDSKCPQFDKFLDQILTKPAQRLLMQLIACSILGDATKEQKLVFLTGEGRNGKTTLVKLLQLILGSLCANVDPSSFMRKSGTHIPNDLARLAGIRLVFTSETKSGDLMDSELMKRMTGGDPILARFLHKEYFEFIAEFVPFIITNYLPVIDGSDFALKRRIIIIPFDVIIEEKDIIKDLEKILFEERNGIFNRILEAITDYQENGLVVPNEINQKINHYVDSSNLFKRFFDENLKIHEGSKISARDLFYRYQKWCNDLNVKAMSEPQFKSNFERSTGIIQEYNSRGNWWPNLSWLNQHNDAEGSVGHLQLV